MSKESLTVTNPQRITAQLSGFPPSSMQRFSFSQLIVLVHCHCSYQPRFHWEQTADGKSYCWTQGQMTKTKQKESKYWTYIQKMAREMTPNEHGCCYVSLCKPISHISLWLWDHKHNCHLTSCSRSQLSDETLIKSFMMMIIISDNREIDLTQHSGPVTFILSSHQCLIAVKSDLRQCWCDTAAGF